VQEQTCSACSHKIDTTVHSMDFSPTSLHYPKEFNSLKIIYCERCGESTTNKPLSIELLNEYYEKYYIGKAYKLRKTTSMNDFGENWYEKRSFSQLMLLNHFIDFHSIKQIYEIGAGEGSSLVTLKKAYPHLELNISEPQSYKTLLFKDLGVNLRAPILDDAPSKASYDLVTMSHALEHFNGQDIDNVLNKIFNSLKTGGHYFCEVPNADLGKYPLAGEKVVPHLTFFSLKSIQLHLEKAGFEIVFANCAGKSQLSKNCDQPFFDKLESLGTFIFKEDESGKFLINQKLLAFTRKEEQREKTKSLLTSNNRVLDLIRKLRQSSPLSFLKDDYFQYSPNNEYIRIIGKKL
jgi:SAM-dependent methyltransferase